MEGSTKKLKKSITLACSDGQVCELKNYTCSELLKDFLDKFHEEETIPITFCDFDTLECVCAFLDKSFVGFTMSQLINTIKACDYLILPEQIMVKLFDQLYPRIKIINKGNGSNLMGSDYVIIKKNLNPPSNEGKNDFTELYPNLITKYLLPRYKLFRDLHHLRQYDPYIWDLVTDEMITRAKAQFPRIAHHNPAILLECAFELENFPSKDISKYLLARQVKGDRLKIRMSAKYMEDAIIKFGSLQWIEMEKLKRKEIRNKEKLKREDQEATAKENRVRNTAILLDYLKPHGYTDYWTKTFKGRPKALSSFQRGLRKLLGQDTIDCESILKDFDAYITLLVIGLEFHQLYGFTTKAKFKEIINKNI
jgi:hypothetical protein